MRTKPPIATRARRPFHHSRSTEKRGAKRGGGMATIVQGTGRRGGGGCGGGTGSGGGCGGCGGG